MIQKKGEEDAFRGGFGVAVKQQRSKHFYPAPPIARTPPELGPLNRGRKHLPPHVDRGLKLKKKKIWRNGFYCLPLGGAWRSEAVFKRPSLAWRRIWGFQLTHVTKWPVPSQKRPDGPKYTCLRSGTLGGFCGLRRESGPKEALDSEKCWTASLEVPNGYRCLLYVISSRSRSSAGLGSQKKTRRLTTAPSLRPQQTHPAPSRKQHTCHLSATSITTAFNEIRTPLVYRLT